MPLMRGIDMVFYTIDEVATLLRISKPTVYREVRRKHLPPIVKLSSGRSGFSRDAIDKIIRAKTAG